MWRADLLNHGMIRFLGPGQLGVSLKWMEKKETTCALLGCVGDCVGCLQGKEEAVCQVRFCVHIACQAPVPRPDNEPSLAHLASRHALFLAISVFDLDAWHPC